MKGEGGKKQLKLALQAIPVEAQAEVDANTYTVPTSSSSPFLNAQAEQTRALLSFARANKIPVVCVGVSEKIDNKVRQHNHSHTHSHKHTHIHTHTKH